MRLVARVSQQARLTSSWFSVLPSRRRFPSAIVALPNRHLLARPRFANISSEARSRGSQLQEQRQELNDALVASQAARASGEHPQAVLATDEPPASTRPLESDRTDVDDGSSSNHDGGPYPARARSSPDSEPLQTGNAPEKKQKLGWRLRQVFKARSPEILKMVNEEMGSAYVSTTRNYPIPFASKSSLSHAMMEARRQVAFGMIAQDERRQVPRYDMILRLLRQMTPAGEDKPAVAALRVVMPTERDFDMGHQAVEFMDSTQGLLAKIGLRATPVQSSDPESRHSFILRGRRKVLARVIDDLRAAAEEKGKEIQIYELGDVATIDYEARQLWPPIDDTTQQSISRRKDTLGSIWAHKEPEVLWIDHPYDQVTKPGAWSRESLEEYITTLVRVRIRPHLIHKFYDIKNTGDAPSARARQLLEVMSDPAVEPFITPHALKITLRTLTQAGSQKHQADFLLERAERIGVPLDIDMYNIILQGHAKHGDALRFFRFLRKVKSLYLVPNNMTWLLLLELVKKDDIRQQIMIQMYNKNIFQDVAARRGTGTVMASLDAYTAFKAGKGLDALVQEQDKRYGENWMTSDAKKSILAEFFRFHARNDDHFDDYQQVLQSHTMYGSNDMRHELEFLMQIAASQMHWRVALWALRELHRLEIELTPQVYDSLISIALAAHSPHCLSIILLYATLERKLRYSSRQKLQFVLLQTFKDLWWREFKPKIMDSASGSILKRLLIKSQAGVVHCVEGALLTTLGGWKPARPLHKELSKALFELDGRMHALARRSDSTRSLESIASDKQVQLSLVPMEPKEGEQEEKVIRLERAFDPKIMLGEEAYAKWKRGRDGLEEALVRRGFSSTKVADGTSFLDQLSNSTDLKDAAADANTDPEQASAAHTGDPVKVPGEAPGNASHSDPTQ